ncbi:MAG: hypothetical protein ACI9U2_002923 [Bradymonadia bacterium]|jgi:hypothetical protein
MDEASNMARLIMDDWRRFFRTHGVPVKGVCRAAKRVMDLGAQATVPPQPVSVQPSRAHGDRVGALTTRVAELEAELARLRKPTDQS